MNDWIGRSIELAERANYLDQLAAVYPIPNPLPQPVNQQTRQKVEELYSNRDWPGLIRFLLTQERFPYQEPFLGCLRADDSAIERNPRTVERVSQILYNLGVTKVIEGVERAPQPNRQLGSLFRRWLRTLPYPRLPREEFINSREICILEGGNGELMAFANGVLGCGLGKRPDLVAKTPNAHVIAEAKFITEKGGNQDKSFREVLNFIRSAEGNATRIGILDGVVWLETGGLYGTVREVEQTAMSALLLRDFLETMA